MDPGSPRPWGCAVYQSVHRPDGPGAAASRRRRLARRMLPPSDAPAAAMPRRRQTTFAPWLALALYAALLAIGIAHHEIWRDEAQAWLLARDSGTPLALLHAMRYEGHPPIWHLLLWLLSRATSAPLAMQVLHGLIALLGAALFLR